MPAFGQASGHPPQRRPWLRRPGRSALPPTVDPAIIDAALTRMVDDKKIVGVSALVYERGREVYFGAFGLADRENNKPMARDTVVQIFSMTKPVTGVALMQLYERGKFQLDDPLAEPPARIRQCARVRRPRREWPAEIRAAEAADHGARHPAAYGRLPRRGPDDTSRGQAVSRGRPARRTSTTPCRRCPQKLAAVPLAYQPGTRWVYTDAVDVQAAPGAEDLGRALRQVPQAAHLQAARHDQTRYTILPTDRRPAAARGDVHAQRRRHVHAPAGRGGLQVQQRRAGRTSPAASAWSRPSTTT